METYTIMDGITEGEMLDKVISVIETEGEKLTDGECLEIIHDMLTRYQNAKGSK